MSDDRIKEFEVTVQLRNNLLKERREALGLSRCAFADMVGVQRTYYCYLEKMEISPFRRQPGKGRGVKGWRNDVLRLAAFYGVQPEELFPEEILAVQKSEASRKFDLNELVQLVSAFGLRNQDHPDGRLEAASEVRALLRALPPKKEQLIVLRFGLENKDPHTLQEIGDLFGISRQRAKDLVDGAISLLRKLMEERDNDRTEG